MKSSTPTKIENWQKQFFNYLRNGKSDPEIFNVRGKTRRERKHRADVYRLDCPGKIQDALQPDFASFIRLIGRQRFDELTLAFAKTFPSKRASLFEVSDDFVSFLASRINAKELRRARLDLAKVKAVLSAKVSPPKTPLMEVTRIRLAPHCHYLEGVLVFRGQGELKQLKLSPAQDQAMGLLQKGTTITRLGKTLEKCGVSQTQAGHWFEKWSRLGLITW